MGYSYEGYYVDPVSLREFAAKTAPETPPGEALNRLYSFCENNGSLLELEDAFKDTHPSWFLALDHTMQKLGIPECLSLSNLICAQVPPFPYPHNEEICFGYLSGKDAATLADKLVDVESMPHEEADSDEIVHGLVLFRQCCRNAVAEKKDIVFIPLDYLDEETDVSPSDFSASPSSSSPHLGQIQFFATVLALPGIGYYLGAMQLGPLLFGKISAEEFAEKWRNLFSMHIGLFLIVLPLIFYILLLTSIWGKFTGKIRKRLLLGSLLTGVLSYIALGAHYGALVNSLGMSLLIGAFVYRLRREG